MWNTPLETSNHSDIHSNSLIGCGKKYFRKRLWGTLNQFRAVFLDKECWMEHMKLDPVTGLDPVIYLNVD